MITECYFLFFLVAFFAYKTMVWQGSTENHEDLFQGNFANNNT